MLRGGLLARAMLAGPIPRTSRPATHRCQRYEGVVLRIETGDPVEEVARTRLGPPGCQPRISARDTGSATAARPAPHQSPVTSDRPSVRSRFSPNVLGERLCDLVDKDQGPSEIPELVTVQRARQGS